MEGAIAPPLLQIKKLADYARPDQSLVAARCTRVQR